MKVLNVPGEYAFKCLFKTPESKDWTLSLYYYFSQADVMSVYKTVDVIWPVEILENGSLYIPSQSELE